MSQGRFSEVQFWKGGDAEILDTGMGRETDGGDTELVKKVTSSAAGWLCCHVPPVRDRTHRKYLYKRHNSWKELPLFRRTAYELAPA